MAELADTSAWVASRRDPSVRERFDVLLVSGLVATCDMVKLELLHSARNAEEFARRRDQLEALPQCPIAPRVWRRVLDVYQRISEQGGSHHRRVTHPDLIIAAAAEAAGVGLLHYDADFETIAAVTGQPARWIAPRGTA
jgi:predicted nucleic acid-binding protein